MKKLVCICLISFIFFSCRKDAATGPGTDNPYLHAVLAQLRDSLSPTDYQSLDTNATYLTDPKKANNYVLRIGFSGKSIAEDFLLLHTDPGGWIQTGGNVHLENTTPANSYQFSGSIRLRSLSGKDVIQSDIISGHILSLHTGRQLSVTPAGTKVVTVLPATDPNLLPEVVVVGYSGHSDLSTYISLDGLLDGLNTGSSGINSGSSSGNSDSGGGGGASGGSTGTTNPTETTPEPVPHSPYSALNPTRNPSRTTYGISVVDPIDIETEYIDELPVINIQKYFNCFDLVPSVGATYSVKLCVDLPMNSSPDASVTFSGGVSSGHTFLSITKSGSGVSITQCFGYYPQTHISLLNPISPIAAVIKDNGDKEINAAVTISISSDEFNTMRTYAVNRAHIPYTLDKSNCTDYALSVFNSVRVNPLRIDPYVNHQPGIVLANGMTSPGVNISINSSPQELYNKLATMKKSSDPEASKIQLDLSHHTKSPASHGECN